MIIRSPLILPLSLFLKDYWRGAVWINMNYLMLKNLNNYMKHNNGAIAEAAEFLYRDLRHSLIENIVLQYTKTGFLWLD